jgi:hypothetical protein
VTSPGWLESEPTVTPSASTWVRPLAFQAEGCWFRPVYAAVGLPVEGIGILMAIDLIPDLQDEPSGLA